MRTTGQREWQHVNNGKLWWCICDKWLRRWIALRKFFDRDSNKDCIGDCRPDKYSWLLSLCADDFTPCPQYEQRRFSWSGCLKVQPSAREEWNNFLVATTCHNQLLTLVFRKFASRTFTAGFFGFYKMLFSVFSWSVFPNMLIESQCPLCLYRESVSWYTNFRGN